MTSTLTTTRALPQTPPSLTVGTSVRCPDPDCDALARVVDTWQFRSTAGPMDHTRTRCRAGHVFTPPSEWLVPIGT
jgi:hypothetical protein